MSITTKPEDQINQAFDHGYNYAITLVVYLLEHANDETSLMCLIQAIKDMRR